MNSPGPFPRLITDRLLLRHLEISDDNEIFFLRSDKAVNTFLVSPIAKSIQDARDFINKINNSKSAYWAITLKGDNKLIGTICIWNIETEENKAEIGYVLHPAYSGKGFMHEALAAVIQHGFRQMKLRILDAVLHQENKKSIILLERNGLLMWLQQATKLFTGCIIIYLAANPRKFKEVIVSIIMNRIYLTFERSNVRVCRRWVSYRH